jgi:hypothetical protein
MAPRTALFWRIGVVNEFNGIHLCSPYLCHTAPGKGHDVRVVGLVCLLVLLITAHHGFGGSVVVTSYRLG